jgi:peptidylprolyl isomerase
VADIRKTDLPPHLKLKTGQRVQVSGPNGGLMTVTVVAESDTTLTFDGNHPLAGKNLVFEITLIEIVEAG